MSKAGRFGLVALAVVIAIVAFVVAKPGDDEEKVEETPAAQTAEEPTATAPSAKEPPADAEPGVREIKLADNQPVGGPFEIKVTKGDTVRLTVVSDRPDEIHFHGYDVARRVETNVPKTVTFQADIEGIFEIESHEAEQNGGEPVIGRLVVEPS